jgi:predicted DNA-binding transcriptional regulator AlpA
MSAERQYMKTQEPLLTVQEVAEVLRVKPSWIYDHADELGAFRLGKYLRFALPRVMERLENTAPPVSPLGGQPADLH